MDQHSYCLTPKKNLNTIISSKSNSTVIFDQKTDENDVIFYKDSLNKLNQLESTITKRDLSQLNDNDDEWLKLISFLKFVTL